MKQLFRSRTLARIITIAVVIVQGFSSMSFGANPEATAVASARAEGPDVRGKSAAAVSVITVNDFTIGTGLNQFEFSSGWQGETQAGNYNYDGHYSRTVDSYYQVRFFGTQVKVYSKTEIPHGIEAISIDGGAETLVDEYSVPTLHQQIIFTSPVLARGNHTLKVRVTGTKNPGASNTYIYADRVDIIDDSTPGTQVKKMLCLTRISGYVHCSIKSSRNGEIMVSHKSGKAFDLLRVELLLLDGTALRELPVTKLGAGVYRAAYGPSGSRGHRIPPGMYMVSAIFKEGRVTQKVSLW